jgi:hypothetical protein
VVREEVSYIKKELIDARSRKAAAEDDLNTVKGTVETLTNSVNSLSIEGKGAAAAEEDLNTVKVTVDTLKIA